MKNIFRRRGGIVLLLSFLAALVITSCTRHEQNVKPADVDYYTCTMHPSVKKQSPSDKCPICSMDLTPVKKTGAMTDSMSTNSIGYGTNEITAISTKSEFKLTEFSIPVKRLQQIGVTYATVQKQRFIHSVRAVGTVAYDKQRHWDYVSRVDGYIQNLSVFSRGELVEMDAPILTIYSPDLLSTQREFVNLLAMLDEAKTKGGQTVVESTGRLVESARQRLHQWNITDAQIAELEKNRKPTETLILRSPFKGVIQDIGVDQGRRVMTGDHLVDIADLSIVWVWAVFYQDELSMLKKGLPIILTSSSYPGEKFEGKISVVDPFINEATRTGRVRIDVPNPELKLRPDMYVDADLTMEMGQGIAVPFNAVLPTGKHNIIFVDKGGGKLEPRFVEIGRKYGDYYEVKSGVSDSERVVTSANFLIDAEAKVQGALKSW